MLGLLRRRLSIESCGISRFCVNRIRMVAMSVAKVGAKAPDFEAPAYQGGGFGQVKLSDYLGKWVVLCFYPGDFTFV